MLHYLLISFIKFKKGEFFGFYFINEFFSYLDNPYHNMIHAIDVTQTTHFILKKCQFSELAELTPLEMAAMYLASSIHDYEHP